METAASCRVTRRVGAGVLRRSSASWGDFCTERNLTFALVDPGLRFFCRLNMPDQLEDLAIFVVVNSGKTSGFAWVDSSRRKMGRRGGRSECSSTLAREGTQQRKRLQPSTPPRTSDRLAFCGAGSTLSDCSVQIEMGDGEAVACSESFEGSSEILFKWTSWRASEVTADFNSDSSD